MSNTSSAGKGDKPRPVDAEKYRSNYDNINWGKKVVSPEVSEK